MEYPLTKSQQHIFDTIERTAGNYLISGKPGVGKSVLTRALVSEGQKHYNVAAPTGLAALNIGGKTLHSMFRLPISEGIVEPTYNKFPIDDRVLNFIKYRLQHLIIDEISMVRADMFDYIDRLMRFAKGQPSLPFGGCQVILVGDFYQLPPVAKRDDVKRLEKAGYESPFVFSSMVFKEAFNVLQLDEVLRQKGDNTFIDVLNGARDGSISPKHLGVLNKRVEVISDDDLKVRLTSTNKEADIVNHTFLNKIVSEAKEYHADSFGTWPQFPCETVLTLKVGAHVMVKMNRADIKDGERNRDEISCVVNGTIGVVEKMEDDGVIITTAAGDTVKIFRKRWEHKIKEKVGDEWTERIMASFEQVPLSLAWAISIHKSQGQTFETVHVDAGRIFAPGQLYVALSRCKSLAGLTLQDRVDGRKFWADTHVRDFFEALEV